MIKTITRYEFEDAFNKSDTYKNNFSYEGKKALFEYFEEYEESTGEKIEFDMVAICCEYSEYTNLTELQENYTDIKDLQDLQDHTQVIEMENGGIIIQNF